MDIGSILFNWAIVFFLVFLNGFFVAAEFAMVKVRGSKIETLLQEGHPQAKYAKELVEHLDAYLSACQLGITLASLGLGWVGEPAIARMLEPLFIQLELPLTLVHTISFIIAFSIITALHIILGELAPKSVAIQKSDRVTLWTAGPLIAFNKIMYPIIYVLNGTSNRLLKLIGLNVADSHEVAHTEEEIRLLMKESHEQGLINQSNLTFVDNIFDFAGTTVEEIMVPRINMICLYLEDSFQENLKVVLSEGKTRYPLCDGDKDNIIGYIHIRDMLRPLSTGDTPQMKELVRDLSRVPATMRIGELLKFFQNNKGALALVLDEYGGTAGMVTLEDVLEEIVGEIQDEFDSETPKIEIISDNYILVDGLTPIDEVEEVLKIDLDSNDLQSIGGWLLSKVPMPPKESSSVVFDDYRFTILKSKEMQIQKIAITKEIDNPSEEHE